MLLEIPEIMRPVGLFRQRMLQRRRIRDARPVIRKVQCVEDKVYDEMKTACLRQNRQELSSGAVVKRQSGIQR